MAHRSVWKGFIRFSLVSIPVKAYTATSTGGGKISLNQLHKDCNSRIQYKKMCPIHGEVKQDQIVSGYELADGRYVVIDPSELEKLESEADKAISISAFIRPDALDPSYYSGKTHFLAPDGRIGEKPYALLHQLLLEERRHAFAQVVQHGKDQIVLLRPTADLIAMTFLCYDREVRKPTEFSGEVQKVEVSPKELEIAKTLAEAMLVEDFDISKYEDQYEKRLAALVEAKMAGEEIVAPAAESGAPQVINLMEALQKSLAEAKKASAAAGKPPKQAAPSRGVAAVNGKKRKASGA